MLRTPANETADPLKGIIGQSPAMRDVYAMTRRVAASTASVLLIGETGTGKELIARAISSLPVPVSPTNKTDAVEAATRRVMA